MSRSVDQRVVEMRFDNKQFETAVSKSRQSMRLMDKDLKSLSVEGAKALYNLDRSFDGFDPTHMGKSIDKIKDSFTTLGVVGMSIVNRLTNDAITKFQEMGNKVIGIFSNLANQVYTRGYNRAKNLESSAFKIEGLLKRSDLSATKSLEVQSKLSKMISDSVDDTAFGLDSASLAASTLASTFGTDEAALENIKTSLYAIAGVAGTTGASYEQVADIFTDVAGQGRAMGMQFQRMSLLGISAQEEVAKYANKELKVREKINKVLGKNAKHELTGADILTAASKKAISAEIFSNAFEGFIETAKEANNTMDGVTSNIGAAMGRLGASFIQPIIQNSGPLVQFLQVVKSGISELKNQIEKVEIPKKITDFFNQVIVVATDHLKDFIEEFKKGNTPLNTFIDNVGKIVDKLTTIFSLFKERVEDNKKSDGYNFQKYLGLEAQQDKSIQKGLEKNSKNYGKSVKDYRKIVDKKHKNWSKEKKQREAERLYMQGFNKDEAHTVDAWKKVWKDRLKASYKESDEYKNIKGKNKKDTKNKKADALNTYLNSNQYKMEVAAKATQSYNDDIQTLIKNYGDLNKLTKLANRDVEETKIFGFDYIKEFIDGFKNIGKAIGNIFGIIGEALEEVNNPLSNFFKMFSGGDEETKESRQALNDFSTQFKETTEKIAEFAKSDGAKFLISDIGKYIAILSKVIGGIFKVIGHAITAFAPLIEKVLNALGKVFGLFSGETEEVSTFDKVINLLCKGIDWLAELLNKVWDAGGKFKDWLKDSGLDEIKTKVNELTHGLIDLTKPFDWIKKLFGWTSDNAGDANDKLEKSNETFEKIGDTAGKVSDVVDKVSESFSKITGKDNKKASDNLKQINNISDTLDKVVEPAEKAGDAIEKVSGAIENVTGSNTEGSEEVGGPLGWIKSVVEWFKEKFSKIEPETVKKVFTAIGAIVSIVATFMISSSIAKGIKQVATGVENLTAGIAQFDVKAERYKQIAAILKSVALLIGVFAVGVFIITKAIGELAKLNSEGNLWIGIGAFAAIAAVIIVLVAVVLLAAKNLSTVSSNSNTFKGIKAGFGSLSGMKGESSVDSYTKSVKDPLLGVAAIIGVFAIGVKLISSAISKLGQMNQEGTLDAGLSAFITISSVIIILVGIVLLATLALASKSEKDHNAINSKSKLLSSVSTILFGIAAIILVYASSVKKIAKTLKLLASLPSGNALDDAIHAFTLIGGSILVLVIVTLLFATLMTRKGTSASAKTIKSITGILAITAAIMAVFAASVKKIMKAIANVAIVGKFADLDKAIDAFSKISLMIIALTAIVAIFTAIILKDKNITPAKIKAMTPILACIALITLALGVSIGLMMIGISIAAKALKGSSESELIALEVMLGISLIAIIGIVAILMASIDKLKGLTKAQASKIEGIFALIAVIILVVAIAMYGIGYAAKNMKGIDKDSMWALVAALGILAALIAVLAFVGILAGKANLKTGPMIALAAMIGVLAVIFIALGTAIALISNALEVNADVVDLFTQVAIIFGILLVVCAVVAGLASKGSITTKGLLVVAALLGALGLIFTAIGKMALNIGKGALLLQTAIERFMSSINRFADMDDKRIEKGAKKVGKGVKDLLIGVVEGIIEFGDTIGGKKDQLTAAITKILDVIQGAITTFFVTLEENILLRLGMLIDKFGPWLDEYEPKLIEIGQKLENIVWWGILEPWLTDLGQWLYEKILWVGDYLIENKQTIVDKLINFGTQMMVGLAQGIEDNKKKITTAIWILLKSICNLLFSFLGLPEPFPEVKEQIDKFKKGVYDMGESVDDQFADGVDKGYDTVKDGIESFCSKVGQAIWDGLKENELIKKAGEWLGNKVYEFMHPWETSEYKQALDKKEGWKKIKEIQAVEVQMRVNLYKSGKSAEEADKAAREWALQQISAIKKAYGIESPSTVMKDDIAKNINLGLQNGLIEYGRATVSTAYKEATHINSAFDAALNKEQMAKKITNDVSAKSLLTKLGNNVKSALPKIYKVIEDSGLFDSDKFIIKPGMDLSQITKDSNTLQKIFDKTGLNINANEAVGLFDSLKKGDFSKVDVSSLANGFDSANDKSSSKGSGKDNNLASINFTQNNYSPESLSQIDIYRQTENLLGKKSTLNSLASSVGLTGTNF